MTTESATELLTESGPEAAYDDWMTRNGVTYSATFVPFSMSRNAKPLRECKTHELSINWRVMFTKDGCTFMTYYQQGIGHLPGYCGQYGNRNTADYRADVIAAVEKGRARKALGAFMTVPVPPPAAADVLDCLALDASVLEAGCFEDWASEYGYDLDSRKAEATYQECVTIARKMRELFGHKALAELRSLERL